MVPNRCRLSISFCPRFAGQHAGYTLLEVLLALLISGIVLAAMSMAIDFHFRVLESGRQDVEEAQLARAILRRIADDLRSAVLYEKLDMKFTLPGEAELGAAASALQSAAGGSGNADAVTSLLSGSGSGTSSGSGSGSSSGTTTEGESSTDVANATTLPNEPGIYGNQYELQVDVSRLPRLDQYEQFAVAGANGVVPNRPSDVKTVAYYVLGGLTTTGSVGGNTGAIGLVRREFDRAATKWAMENGGFATLDQYQEVVAPEVIALEFEYFDGTTWVYDWDSSARKGIPMAVRISLALLMPSSGAAAMPTGSTIAALDMEGYPVYRLLVHLPAAKPTTLDGGETGSETESSEATQSNSGSGTSSSSNASSGSMP